jgi:GTP-binding protein LepA
VGDRIHFMANGRSYDVTEVGVMKPPKRVPVTSLKSGEVGYIAASIKEIGAFVGDTVTHASGLAPKDGRARKPALEPLPGYQRVTPMVFCGLYPIDNDDYGNLKESLEKLRLNDSSISFEPENSEALGHGFRCGFLGLLHMEIIQERLEREYNLSLITTAPSVIYRVHLTNGTVIEIDNPARLPDPISREFIEEPMVKISMICRQTDVGTLMELSQERRGIFLAMDYIEGDRVNLQYELPLNEMVTDFYDQLKSRSKGYASMDYSFSGYTRSDLVKLDLLIAGDIVDALSVIVHRDKAYNVGRQLTEKLKELIPRQMFEVPIQAAIGGRVLARTTVKAMRKNVLEKCYGGDISRKRKLLEKQKEGKKRMKSVGRVDVPQEAFMAVLKLGD